ncbi:MAG: serpin family protein [Chlamydiota bacterium]
MRKTILCFLSFLSLGCAEPISHGINSFGSDFYQQSLSDENICFSPYSLFSCLSTAYLGSRGDTEEELVKALHIDVDQKNFSHLFSKLNKSLLSDRLDCANAIWLGRNFSLLNGYEDSIQDFDVQVKNLDFSDTTSSASIINAWVAKKTNDTIKKILSPSDLSKETGAVITNAIHFQSVWMHPFSTNRTTTSDFYINDKESSSVQMMQQTNHFPYYENDSYQLLLLPVLSSDSSYNCFFLLPKTSFNDLENTFNLSSLLDQMHLARHESIDVRLPRFILEKTLNTKEVLQNLGIKKAFSSQANFLGLIKEGNLCIDKVLHKAFFSIGETGVTASAATAITMRMTATCHRQELPISFTADHPFIFGIVDLNSDVVLFLGKLTRP